MIFDETPDYFHFDRFTIYSKLKLYQIKKILKPLEISCNDFHYGTAPKEMKANGYQSRMTVLQPNDQFTDQLHTLDLGNYPCITSSEIAFEWFRNSKELIKNELSFLSKHLNKSYGGTFKIIDTTIYYKHNSYEFTFYGSLSKSNRQPCIRAEWRFKKSSARRNKAKIKGFVDLKGYNFIDFLNTQKKHFSTLDVDYLKWAALHSNFKLKKLNEVERLELLINALAYNSGNTPIETIHQHNKFRQNLKSKPGQKTIQEKKIIDSRLSQFTFKID